MTLKFTKNISILLVLVFSFLFTNVSSQSFYRYKKMPKYSSNIHWLVKKNTATGRHKYMIPAWNSYNTCKTYSQLPTKPKTYWRYRNWKRK
jgi:hypothetical protein